MVCDLYGLKQNQLLLDFCVLFMIQISVSDFHLCFPEVFSEFDA